MGSVGLWVTANIDRLRAERAALIAERDSLAEQVPKAREELASAEAAKNDLEEKLRAARQRASFAEREAAALRKKLEGALRRESRLSQKVSAARVRMGMERQTSGAKLEEAERQRDAWRAEAVRLSAVVADLSKRMPAPLAGALGAGLASLVTLAFSGSGHDDEFFPEA